MTASACVPRVDPADLHLQRLYHWERTAPDRVCLTQPFDGGQLRTYTWRELADQARRMATFLQEQAWPPGSRIGILGKNSAGWIAADLAIWMAGHVTVPLYPLQSAQSVRQMMEHSETLACFVGKLDSLDLLNGLPGGLLLVALPLAPATAAARCAHAWDALVAQTPPIAGSPVRAGSDLATLVYTSGTTGQAKGVMHSFDTLASGVLNQRRKIPMTPEDRVLSYLPLAHIMESGNVMYGAFL